MSIKDKIAQERGYPSWETMFDWISRDGEKPVVVAQLIESACIDVCIETVRSMIHDKDVIKALQKLKLD